jgi:hypothetical protein
MQDWYDIVRDIPSFPTRIWPSATSPANKICTRVEPMPSFKVKSRGKCAWDSVQVDVYLYSYRTSPMSRRMGQGYCVIFMESSHKISAGCSGNNLKQSTALVASPHPVSWDSYLLSCIQCSWEISSEAAPVCLAYPYSDWMQELSVYVLWHLDPLLGNDREGKLYYI